MDPLVGRDVERGELAAALAAARTGRGGAVLLSGPAGVGKTSLVEDLVGGGCGCRVAWGRCVDGEAPPYWPWRQALRALDVDVQMPAGDPLGRPEMFARVADALAEAAAGRPVVLVLEDLHWADPASVALLRFVVSVLPGLPLLLTLTSRDSPDEVAEHTARLLADLPPGVRRLPVPGLDEAATVALARRVSPLRLGTDVEAALHRRTGGNPYFVVELARLHAARGRTDSAVPAGVRAVLTRRLARLPQPTLELLQAACVLGEPDPGDLGRSTGLTYRQVLVGLGPAIAAGLVVDTADGPRFDHALVRETLHAELGPSRLASLHRAIADNCPDLPAAERAVHWYRAGDPDSRRRAGHAALVAARAAMSGTGYEQAARYFRWALDAEADDPIVLTRELGEAQLAAGRLAEGRDTLRAAADLARAGGNASELARAALALGSGLGGFEVDLADRTQQRLLEDAEAALPAGDEELRAAVLARLSLVRAGQVPPGERAQTATAAVEMARRLGEARVEIAALGALCDAIAGPDHVAERASAGDRMVGLALRCGDAPLQLLARRLRLVARLELGDLSGVDAEIAAYAAVSDRLRMPFFSWPVPIWRGMRCLLDGDPERAWRLSEEAERLGEQAGSANAGMMVFTLRTAIHAVRGTLGEFLPQAEQFLPVAESVAGLDILLARLHAAAGQRIPADRHLQRALAGLSALERDSEWLELMWQLGDAGLRLGDRTAVRAAHDALLPYRQLWVVDGIGGACLGPVDDHLDRLAAFLDAARAETAPASTTMERGAFVRSGGVWQLDFRGRQTVVPHTKGMSDLAALLAAPGRQVHVLDLVEAAGGPPRSAAEASTGPVLDSAARAAYTRRLRELQSELEEADRANDRGRSEKLSAEREFLVAELGAAVGLRGRDRMTGDRVEKARKAVAMRVTGALRAIESAHPQLGRHLRSAVSTGRFCCYRPDLPVQWRLRDRS